VDNVILEIGDGARGWPAHAPYDAIVLTGSTPLLPRAFLDSLNPGGRLFAVVGQAPAMKARLITCTAPGAWHSTDLFETVIRPLANAEQPPRFRF
jgi:protein-L-isoaspartate(D-aspartate) O-methyltransferase